MRLRQLSTQTGRRAAACPVLKAAVHSRILAAAHRPPAWRSSNLLGHAIERPFSSNILQPIGAARLEVEPRSHDEILDCSECPDLVRRRLLKHASSDMRRNPADILPDQF